MKYSFCNILCSIKNAQKAKKLFILQKKTKILFLLLNVLWEENFILGYQTYTKNNYLIKIFISYKNNIDYTIKNINYITKSSQKIYYNSKQMWKININLGLFIFSTNQGIMTLKNCKKKKVGGKLICVIR